MSGRSVPVHEDGQVTAQDRGRVTVLQALASGTRAVVREIHGGHGLRRRLGAVGLHPGDTLEVLQAGANTSPVLIEIHGARVAIGRGQAERVEVEVIGPP